MKERAFFQELALGGELLQEAAKMLDAQQLRLNEIG